MKLMRFGEILASVERTGYLNILCTYLYELTKSYMSFYQSLKMLDQPEPIRTSRLYLSQLTAAQLKRGLALLGIRVVPRM